MNTRLKIVKWISWEEAKLYSEHDNYEEARECVIEEIKKKGIQFDGLYHDVGKYGVPIFDDGTRFTTSWRGWGRVMHMAYPDETESYVDYYMNPEDFSPPYPDDDWDWDRALESAIG